MPKIDIVNAKNIIESNPEKAFFKLKNTGGPKGDTGAQGPQGPKGDQGEPGAPGASASVTVGSTTTLSPGADATVTNSGDTRNAILNFGIPTGAQGPQGIQGPKGDTGPMGQTGAKGDTGAAATVQVGNTNTGAPGTNAQVTNAGNEHFAVFNFTIPRGDKGEKGATGAQGAKGDKGDKGDTGAAATITVGSTTTTNPGTNATVTNSGTTSAAVLNFGIPRGATGSVKSDVVAELPETGEEDTFYLVNREATEQTATGNAIRFTNNDNAGDITDFKLDGETSQSGTPTPSAPVPVNTTTGENVVKITGKNLFNETATPWVATTHYNTTTGAIEAWANYYGIREYQPVSASTQYIVSSAVSGNLQVVFYDGSKTFLSATSGSASFTTPANCQYVRWSRYTETAPTNTQLELGSTATAYEPYQGQSYEVNLGKNLFDKDNANILSAYIDSGQRTITANNNNRIMWIRCEPSTTYTITKTPANYQRGIAYTKELPTSGVQTYGYYSGQNNWENLSFTTGADAKYLVIRIWVVGQDSISLDDMLASVQVEKGSQATSYATYFEPIELCKIGDYQDYIYKSGGKWYVRKEVEHRSITASSRSSIDVAQTNTARVNYGTILSSKKPTFAVIGYMNYELAASASNWSADNAGFYWDGGNGGFWVRFLKSAVGSTTADVDSFLSGKTFELYYPLTTPTDTEITNEALITQLDNVASAPLYTGVNNITTITPNEQGTLEIKYVTYDKYNQNKVYIWNDTLQQWQIIVP